MKKKSNKAIRFLEDLYEYLSTHPRIRHDTTKHSEADIQRELRQFIIEYLQDYWKDQNIIDYRRKANASFYWEGQEGSYKKERTATFASRNYPDFIVKEPYKIAIEYKQSNSGALIKRGIGQCLIHTLSGDFDFVLFIFKDQNRDSKIAKCQSLDKEKMIIDKVWRDFNVVVKILPFKS